MIHEEFGKGNVGTLQTYFNCFKCFIGIGILATPAAFGNVGVLAGAIGISIVGALNLYTMHLQIACKRKMGDHIGSYSELGYAVFGVYGKAFIDLCIFVSQIGFCVAYLLFVGNQMDQVICYETLFDYCGMQKVYITFGMLILIPICWLKTFKFIAYISLFANVSIIFARNFPFLTHLFSNRNPCLLFREHVEAP